MGAEFSTSINSVYVAVEKPVYFPGQTVAGRVLLNCVTPFSAESLTLKLVGYEATCWLESYGNTVCVFKGQREVLASQLLLATYDKATVNPGQYEYPFTFSLPMGLPASFDIKQNSESFSKHSITKGKINYKLKAEVHVPGVLKHNLRHKLKLLVQDQNPTRSPREQVVQDEQPITLCCYVKKGTASITAQLEKDYYYPGEVANIILQVTNISSVKFEKVHIKLMRYISLVDRLDKWASHRRVKTKVAIEETSGVNARAAQVGEAARTLALPLPSVLLPTAVGSLVSCTYAVEVLCKAPAFMSDVVVRLPVYIRSAVPAEPLYTQPPLNWKPQVVVGHAVVGPTQVLEGRPLIDHADATTSTTTSS